MTSAEADQGPDRSWSRRARPAGRRRRRARSALFGRWYIPRREPRYLRRNALVVLGNVGRPARRPARRAPLLERALADRRSAGARPRVWAAHRLGRSDLAAGLTPITPTPTPLVQSRELDRSNYLHSRSSQSAAGGHRRADLKHLLVTNDFPPKHGGIQSYLWELWRRLPADEVTVLTTPHEDAAEWDRAQPFRVVRSRQRVLLPTPGLRRQIDRLAAEVDAELVLLDPALPLGLLGPALERPYGVVRARGRGRRPGSRCPASGRCCARCCWARRWWWPPAATRPTRASWRPGGACRSPW